MPRLNDTQTLLLAHAARDKVGSFYPVPESHARAGARLSRALAALVSAGLATEGEPNDVSQTYRQDGDLRFALFITPAGLKAIGIEPQGSEDPVDLREAAEAPAPDRRTKAAAVLGLLQRPEGATLAELIDLTGWLPHTTRAALTGLRKRGHAVIRARCDRGTCYKVAP